MAPVVSPKHNMSVLSIKVTAKIGGSVMVKLAVFGPQLLASETVTT